MGCLFPKCGQSKAAAESLATAASAAADPGSLGTAAVVALFGADLVEGVLEQLPVVGDIISLIKRVHEKYKDRKDMLKWLEALDSFVVYLSSVFPELSNTEDAAIVSKAMTDIQSTLEAGILDRVGRLAEPEKAIEELRDLNCRLQTAVALVNFRHSIHKRQAPVTRHVRQAQPKDLEILDLIGRGMFAVHRGKLRQGRRGGREDVIDVAVKVYPATVGGDVSELLRDVEKNTKIQMSVSHCNVLRILCSCTGHQSFPDCVLLVTELMPLGSLARALFPGSGESHAIQAVHSTITGNADVLMQVLFGVTSAVQHMHAHSPPALHLDLKSANVLLQKLPDVPGGGSMNLRPVVCDFDASKEFKEYHTSVSSSITSTMGLGVKGTIIYMAPERLQAEDEADAPPADMYSLGMLIVESVNVQVPFSGLNAAQILNKVCVKKEQPRLDASKKCFNAVFPDIVQGCLAFMPTARLTAGQVASKLSLCLEPLMAHPKSNDVWWHGTSELNALEIQQSGFTASTDGFCGRGVYLTSSKTKAEAWARYAAAGRPCVGDQVLQTREKLGSVCRSPKSRPAVIRVKASLGRCKDFEKGLIDKALHIVAYEAYHSSCEWFVQIDELGRVILCHDGVEGARYHSWQSEAFDSQYVEDAFGNGYKHGFFFEDEGYAEHIKETQTVPGMSFHSDDRMHGDELVLRNASSAVYISHEILE